jgi:hypothetical protein
VRVNAPDSPVDENVYRVVSVKVQADLARYVIGVIQNLSDPNFWYGSYAYTNNEIAEIFSQMEFNVADCDSVADCIETNPDITDIINQIIDNRLNETGNGAPIGYLGNTGENFSALKADGTCDLDKLWGMISAAELAIYNAASEFWVQVVASISYGAPGWIARMIDLFPGIGDLPSVDDINEVILTLNELAELTWEIGYNDTKSIENRCAIFETVCNGCGFTLDAFINRYSSLANTGVAGGIWSRLFDFRYIASLPETLVAFGMLTITEIMASENGVVRNIIQADIFSRIVRAADPSDDHIDLCDGCKPPKGDWAFEWSGTDLHAFYPALDLAPYRLPNGLGSYGISGGQRVPLSLKLFNADAQSYRIVSFEIDWQGKQPGQTSFTIEQYVTYPPTSFVIASNASGSGALVAYSGTAIWNRNTGDSSYDDRQFIQVFNNPYGSECVVTRLLIWGEGDDTGFPEEQRIHPPQ